jgi:glycosyltransferase involved in cell wall biosynthesis
MSRALVLNGKYLSAAPTGVHRVANEFARALAELAAEDHAAVRGLDIIAWVPRNATDRACEIGLATRVVQGLTGIAWEQLTLPAQKEDQLLLNLCNIGPIFCSNAVTMIHDAQVYLTPESYSRPFRLWYRFIQPQLASRHRRILTVSEYSRRELVRFGLGSPERIGVIHNGVDHIARVTPDPKVLRRLGLGERGFALGFSTLQAHKNVRLLLRAFASHELAGLPLVLVGGDGTKAFARAGLPVPRDIRFAGRVGDGELRALMEAALCLVFPSTTEGFGLPPLEAMALGTPSIVAPCGALPEVCGDAVLYAPPHSAAAWVKAILSIAESPEKHAAIAQLGQSRARRFTWRSAALRLLDEVRPWL